MDHLKGFFDWRGDSADIEPRYGVFYLTGLSVAAAFGIVVWLGWTWQALVLTILTTLLIGGVVTYLAVKRYRREQSKTPEWR